MLHTMLRGPSNIDAQFDRDLAQAPAVPVTCLYSRSDGVVHWRACLRADISTVEVPGSHVGMGVNADVYREIAHLLAA
jgi:hypothetical protein